MKILALTQARIGSTRMPAKILKTIKGESLLQIHLKRIIQSKLITKLKVATTNELDSDKIVTVANNLGIEVSKGSLNNVLERFYYAALPEQPDWIVRLTSDCPLIDPNEIDKVIQHAISNDYDYVSNFLDPTFPDGLDAEIFKFSALEKTMKEAKLVSELEYVTSYIWKNSTFLGGNIFRSDCVKNDIDYSSIRMTVDTIEDFMVIEKLVELLGPDKPWMDYVRVLEQHPEIKKLNEHSKRNEGYAKSIQNDKTI